MGVLEVEVARSAGACYGVKRALGIARGAAGGPGPVHTLGALIHNPRVVSELADAGVAVADTLDEAGSGTLVLRSHGSAPAVIAEAEERGFEVLDATCPYVAKVQRHARELGESGRAVVIIGEPGHAEVESIRAWGGDAVVAVADVPSKLPETLPAEVGVVIQTTQSQEHVDAVLEAVREKCPDVLVEETVCHATRERQAAAAELAGRVEVMLVVGGRNSGNTTRLAEICAGICPEVHHIEGADDICDEWFSGIRRVGVTAGASTPQEHIDAVLERLETVRA